MGATGTCAGLLQRSIISIHTPTMGATQYYYLLLLYVIFQSTPPRWGRHPLVDDMLQCRKFQSTPPRWGRRSDPCDIFSQAIFQSTPHEGGDPLDLRPGQWHINFNPRPHDGGDNSSSIISEIEELFQSTPPRWGRRQGCH